MRSAVPILVALIILGGAAGLYLWHQPDTKVPTSDLTPTTRTTLRPNDSNMVVGGGDRPWVKNYDKAGNVETQFRAQEYTPRKDGTVRVTRPQAIFFLNGGQELRLDAADGVIVVNEAA